MSDLTIEQLEHYKILMEPTPPFLDALIAEKQAHAKLRAEAEAMREEIGSLIGKLETRAENAHSNRSYTSAVAFRESARDLTRILEGVEG